MSRAVCLAIALLAAAWCVPAFPLAGGHPAGLPVGQNPDWPKGLADLLNSPGRVHGYFVNANDFFFYRGDTEEFNEFLEQYARLEKTPLTLVLQPGPGKIDFITPDDKEITFDWEADLYCRGWAREAPPDPTGKAGKYVVTLKVYPAGGVELNKIKAPLNVKLRSGTENEEFAKFIAAQEEKRKQPKEGEGKAKPLPATEAEQGTVRFIDLDPYVTAPLEAFHGGDVGSDLPLEPGKQRIGGFDFRIGKGVIQLGGSNLPKMPREVKGIKVGLKFKRLWILHSCSGSISEGTRIGSYIIHYDGGTTVEIPVEYGVHVKDWWADWGDTPEVSGAEVAWTSGNAVSPPVRLYAMAWENPSPDKAVVTIDCTSTGTECAPFILAMRAEDVNPSPGTAPAETADPTKSTSARPLYARIALNETGAKALSVVFEESRGIGKGYDLVYADVNFNGKFEETEKLEARTLEPEGEIISSSFPSINANVAYNDKAENLGQWQIAFGYHTARSEERTDSSFRESGITPVPMARFHVRANLTLTDASAQWRYFMSGDIKSAESPETAATWGAHRGLKFQVETRPDGRNKGKLGIGLKLDAGENKLACQKGGLPAKAHVEIKKPDGTVVHTGDEMLDKFVFG